MDEIFNNWYWFINNFIKRNFCYQQDWEEKKTKDLNDKIDFDPLHGLRSNVILLPLVPSNAASSTHQNAV